MIEPEIRASEVHVLLPDIRLERSECTVRTQVPFSSSYLGRNTGIKISWYGDTKQKKERTYDTARLCIFSFQLPRHAYHCAKHLLTEAGVPCWCEGASC
jgi:hypothetical protein